MRRRRLKAVGMSAIVLILALVGVACKKVNKDFAKASNERYAKLEKQVAATDEGIFYIGSDNLIHFVSVDTHEDIIFCTDLNCKHVPASADNPDPECRAALFDERTKIAYYEGIIYYFVQDGIFEHGLYKMDINGTGRELIATFPFTYSTAYGVVFCGDYLYYTANEIELDEETFEVKGYERLIEVNITDGSYRFLTDIDRETKQFVSSIDVEGDSLYLGRRKYMPETGLYQGYVTKIDLNSLEETMVMDLENTSNKKYYSSAYDENSFYYYTMDTNLIGIYNFATGEDKVLVEVEEGKTLSPHVYASNEGVVYYLLDTSTNEKQMWYFDTVTGVTRKVLDEYNDYIYVYDGFRQVCVYNVLGEDGRTIIAKEAVKLEDILGK